MKVDLYNGDCLEVMDKLIGGGYEHKIDAIICDPPFGTTACDWDTVIPFNDMWERLNKLIKDRGAICLFGSEPFSSALRMSNIKNYKYDWIWNKKKGGNPLIAKVQPIKVHEIISVFNIHNYYPIMTKRDKPTRSGNVKNKEIRIAKANCIDKLYTEKYPKSIVEFSNANQKGKFHPTQKPVELLQYLIKTYTQENETVLDFTMGSGSTGVACVSTNRNFIGIELDKGYFDIAKKRIDDANTSIFDL